MSKTPNGENPLMHGASPILGVDVWEHSYYIDYRNARQKYLEAWFDNLVNWEYVEAMLGKAKCRRGQNPSPQVAFSFLNVEARGLTSASRLTVASSPGRC